MTHDDDQPFRKVFDVRQVNLTKLDKVIDLEIIVAECAHAMEGINRQLQNNYGDKLWQSDALRAMVDIAHKQNLAKLKLTAVTEAKAKAKPVPVISPEQNFKSRFMKAAEELLARPLYAQIYEAARFKGEAA